MIEPARHPGHLLRALLEARGWSQTDLAFVLGVGAVSINNILNGKRSVTADMARALGDAFGVPAEDFARAQAEYDLAHAREPHPSVAKKGRLATAYPVREMVKRGWIDCPEDMPRFFGVASTDEIPHLNVAHAARKSTAYDQVPPAQLAWLLRVRQIASEMVVDEYSAASLRDAVERLRPLMIEPEEARHVPRVLAEAGIRFVLVEALQGSKIDGACTWIGGAPVIALSARFDRIDNFWFVLWHELAHVRHKHGRDAVIVDHDLESAPEGGAGLPPEEVIANTEASVACCGREADSFIARKAPFFREQDLIGFAARQGIHPGIAAGQIRKKTGKWKLFARHLARVRSIVASTAIVDGWGDVADLSEETQ